MRMKTVFFAVASVFLCAGFAFAGEGGGSALDWYPAITQLAAAFTISIGALAPALAIGKIAGTALEAIGRNPQAAGDILTNMVLAVAFAEALAIYALVVALAIKFVPVGAIAAAAAH